MKRESRRSERQAPLTVQKSMEPAIQDADHAETHQPTDGHHRHDGRNRQADRAQAGRQDRRSLTSTDVEVGLRQVHPLDEKHPGDASAENVGLQNAVKRPALEVRRLNVARQQDRSTGAMDPIAKLDVLDSGASVTLGVEAAEVEKEVSPDRAAAGPEGVDRARVIDEIALLMDEMVE